MPMSTTWYRQPEQNAEVLEMVATDTHASTTLARSQLIELAALLMEDDTAQAGGFDKFTSMVMNAEGDRSLKMAVCYRLKDEQNLAPRMMHRRRMLLNAAQSSNP